MDFWQKTLGRILKTAFCVSGKHFEENYVFREKNSFLFFAHWKKNFRSAGIFFVTFVKTSFYVSVGTFRGNALFFLKIFNFFWYFFGVLTGKKLAEFFFAVLSNPNSTCLYEHFYGENFSEKFFSFFFRTLSKQYVGFLAEIFRQSCQNYSLRFREKF